ncbi:TspO/MBR family protein [Thiohalorhabdus sp.]|uniref:TspO/MBR family protein n=1 Tax=Thiohalorhabdus sp. TaxID=3094134 RepID=UPI002FC30419
MEQRQPLRSWKRDLLGLLGFVAVCLAVSGLGGAVTATSVGTWYPELAKPWFTPPEEVFGPVWTALFLLMAVAAWRIWRGPPARGRLAALNWFGVQLVLNPLWSVVFFGLRAPGWALVAIMLLLAAIVGTVRRFWGLDRWAGAALIPYLAWVAFAASLNGGIWWLN